MHDFDRPGGRWYNRICKGALKPPPGERSPAGRAAAPERIKAAGPIISRPGGRVKPPSGGGKVKMENRKNKEIPMAVKADRARGTFEIMPEAARDWSELTDGEQWSALQHMTGWVKAHDGALRAGQAWLPPVLDWAVNAGDLEDVAAEAWLIMADRVGDYPSLKTALYAATVTAAQRCGRAVRHDHAAPEDYDPDGLTDSMYDRPEAAAMAAALLDRLEPVDRLIVQLRASGYTLEEIGAAAGIGKSTVARHLDDLRRRLGR